MSPVDWCGKPTEWYKECCKCKTGFWVDTEKPYDVVTACTLMFQYFGNHIHTSDRLSAECRECAGSRCAGRQARQPGDPHRDEMLEAQGGICALCPRRISFKAKTAHIDHCHRSGKTRKILCFNCNKYMSLVDDYNNEGWLAKAIAYRDSFR